MEEVWRDIKGYEGLYKVSNLGRVKSFRNFSGFNKKFYKREKIMTPVDNGRGYLHVMLSKNKNTKHVYIHRLVAQSFLPNPNNLQEINHKDENKKNNRVDNLEWISRKDNVNYGTATSRQVKARSKPVTQIKNGKIINTFTSMREAARMTGFLFSSIQGCCTGKYKQAYGYEWRFTNEIHSKQYNKDS